jgi:hypothetical protein
MSTSGRMRPVVTISYFSTLATCYAGSTGRDRPEADLRRIAKVALSGRQFTKSKGKMDQFFERIGEAALAIANVDVETFLIYTEVEHGVVSSDIFFKPVHGPNVQFRFAPPTVREQIYDFWTNGSVNVPPRAWAAMEYVIHSGKFAVEFRYQEDFLSEEALHDRRPRVVAANFPGAKVDYSQAR